jgi:hypothetical protein
MRINDDVSAELPHVTCNGTQTPSLNDQPSVGRPCREAEDIAPASSHHPVSVVGLAILVQQKRPKQSFFANVRFGNPAFLERDRHHGHSPRFQRGFVLPQLRQMFLTQKSGEMPVKDHQEPATGVLLKRVVTSLGIRQKEWDSRLANLRHGNSSSGFSSRKLRIIVGYLAGCEPRGQNGSDRALIAPRSVTGKSFRAVEMFADFLGHRRDRPLPRQCRVFDCRLVSPIGKIVTIPETCSQPARL